MEIGLGLRGDKEALTVVLSRQEMPARLEGFSVSHFTDISPMGPDRNPGAGRLSLTFFPPDFSLLCLFSAKAPYVSSPSPLMVSLAMEPQGLDPGLGYHQLQDQPYLPQSLVPFPHLLVQDIV